MTLAEGFSAAGVACFVVDAKGDLSALARSTPARFLDCFGDQGEPARLSMQRLRPELLARVLGLSDAQSGVLEILFSIAESRAVAVHTIADLAAVIRYARDNAASVRETFGHFTPTSLSAISRALLRLEREGGQEFFGADSFDFVKLFADEPDGRGRVSILAADRLLRSPSLYAAFIVHLLADVFERMPEAGDLPAPRLVLFIDEAHLLFQDCPPAVLQRVERVMRLIRSKGVGVYYVTQSPADIPPNVLGQLGNRIQHALRGATPADLRAIKAAADTMPAPPGLDTADAIAKLGVGFALVSTIGASGEPRLVERVRVNLPRCPLEPLARHERPKVAPLSGAARMLATPAARAPAVNPWLAGFVVLAAAAGLGVALFYWWKVALAVTLGAFLFLRRAIRA
jgi:DNA helicase HerA-like ATPase